MAKNAIGLAWENVVKDPVISYVKQKCTTKMALKKSIRKLYLTSIQLQTILTKIEAVTNSRRLVYVNNEVEHRTLP